MNNLIYNIRQPSVYAAQSQQPSLGNTGGGGGTTDEMSTNTIKQNSEHLLSEKLLIGLDHVPSSFHLREQITGVADANLQYIKKETGVNITLRGLGSLFVEPSIGTESQEPLHFFIEHQRLENLTSAKQLAKNLIETLQQEFLQFQQQQQSPALPQINVPPPSLVSVPPPTIQPIIHSNVAPPTVPTAGPAAANIVHQQLISSGGIPIHIPHTSGSMVIQQHTQPSHQGGHNLSIPPPMKQIVQFHQPPPQIQAGSSSLQTTQATSPPIILNHHPQAQIQYQYIQQHSRNAQGNPLTLQQVYHQQPPQIQGLQMQALPPPQQLSQQQQFITVQGNTAYMVPPPTIIQQAQGQPTQLSIIQHPSPLQMQLPPGSITVQAPITEIGIEQNQISVDQALSTESGEFSIEKCEEPEHGSNIEEESGITQIVENETLLCRTLTSVPPPHQQLMRQPPPPPMTHVPPPTITMSVPPPMNGLQQHIVGNTLYTTTTTNQGGNIQQQQFQQQVIPLQPQSSQTHQYIHTTPTGQNYVMNTATTQWQARPSHPTQFVTQQIPSSDMHTLPPPAAVSMNNIPVSGTSVQQTTPMAVTFSQPMMQPQLQLQFQPQMMQQAQMQTQPPTQQFNIIHTQPPPPQALLHQQNQQQQQQQMGLISVSQNGLAYNQTASNTPPTYLHQQMQLQKIQQQRSLPPPPSTYGEKVLIRSGQKRKSTSDTTDGPLSTQTRLGVGAQRDVADYTQAPPPPPPPPPTTSSSNLNSTGGVGIGQDNGFEQTTITSPKLIPTTVTTQHSTLGQKSIGHHAGYIGMMRYNSEARRLDGTGQQSYRSQYISGPPPRGRMLFNSNHNNMRSTSHNEATYRMGFAPPSFRSETTGQGMNYSPRRMQR